jgi:hypothetical protein
MASGYSDLLSCSVVQYTDAAVKVSESGAIVKISNTGKEKTWKRDIKCALFNSRVYSSKYDLVSHSFLCRIWECRPLEHRYYHIYVNDEPRKR